MPLKPKPKYSKLYSTFAKTYQLKARFTITAFLNPQLIEKGMTSYTPVNCD